MGFLFGAVFAVFINPLVGWGLGCRAGRPVAGALYGLLLGPIGWFVVSVFPDEAHCQERTRRREDRILANRYLADQYRRNH